MLFVVRPAVRQQGLGSGRGGRCSCGPAQGGAAVPYSVRSAEEFSAGQAVSRVGWLCSQCARSWAVCCAVCSSQGNTPALAKLAARLQTRCLWDMLGCSEATGHCSMSQPRSDQGCCPVSAPTPTQQWRRLHESVLVSHVEHTGSSSPGGRQAASCIPTVTSLATQLGLEQDRHAPLSLRPQHACTGQDG